MSSQCCKTCGWYDASYYLFTEEDGDDAIGQCEWPADNLPFSLRYGNRERMATHPNEGTECVCWKEKTDD